MAQTFGLPVVPEVYTKVARSLGRMSGIWKLLEDAAPSSRTSWNDRTWHASFCRTSFAGLAPQADCEFDGLMQWLQFT